MKVWMTHIRNLESFVDEHERLLDVWGAGGVDGLVLGYMQFSQREMMAHSRRTVSLPKIGTQRAAFDPDPRIYRRFDVPTPPPPDGGGDDRTLRTRLVRALEAVIERGWQLWLFDPFIGAGCDTDLNDNATRILDERIRACLAARMLDTVQAFPMATGVIVDGPAWGFEITDIEIQGMERRRYVFGELPPSAETGCRRLGYDYSTLVAAKEQLWKRLHQLTPARVRLHAPGGLTGAVELLGGDALAEWLAFRTDALTDFTAYMHATLNEHTDGPVRFAVCPRTPAIASMAGYDYERIAHHAEVVMPKFYYWHRGYDGLVGTWWRWAGALSAWNPDLSVADACRVIQMFFGPDVPIVDDLVDFDLWLTPDHLRHVTAIESARAVAAVGDRAGVVPWVDTGRAPHDGDPLTAAHLRATLDATGGAGIDHITFFNSTNLTAADWTILSRYCGTTWDPRATTWRPPDQPTL